jgi:general secretion pathway protein D
MFSGNPSRAGQWRHSVKRALAMAGIGVLLAGCAGQAAFRDGQRLLQEGKLTDGLAKLEEASKLDPHNGEFRLVYLNRKQQLVNGFNTRGENARSQGQLDEAEQWYNQALAIEAANVIAKQGMAQVVQARRHEKKLLEVDAQLKKGDSVSLKDAHETLRTVLLENPQNRTAQNLKSRLAELQNKRSELRLASMYRKPITLEFRDAPLRSVVDFIAKVSGLNIYFDRDVRPELRTTILTRNTPIDEAIRMVLATNALEQSVVNENSILIYPNTPQKQKDYQQLLVRTFFLANGDAKTVSYSIKTLLKARDIVTDDRLGLIIMRDTPEMIRMAERLIAVQDLADPEVMLEVEVLEIKRARLLNLGIQWPDSASLTLAGSSKSATGTPQLTLSDLSNINRGNINLSLGATVLNLKKTDGDSNILANPRIRVRNKEKAKIMIGDKVPVFTSTNSGNGVVAGNVTYLDVGLTLMVEPNIYLDDEVAIKLSMEVSSIIDQVTSNGTSAYRIGTRNANTVLRLKDGETQVLAGLINDADRRAAYKVPGVGELPLLNRIFGSQEDESTRSEIVLSITPRIMRAIRRPDLESAEFNSGSENNVGGHVLTLSGGGGGEGAAGAGVVGTLGGNGAGPEAAAAPAQVRSPMTGGGDDGLPVDKGAAEPPPQQGPTPSPGDNPAKPGNPVGPDPTSAAPIKPKR